VAHRGLESVLPNLVTPYGPTQLDIQVHWEKSQFFNDTPFILQQLRSRRTNVIEELKVIPHMLTTRLMN